MRIATLADGCRVRAPAKVNLVLEVLGKRPDGYHDLAMANVTISVHDTLTFRPSTRGITCASDHPDLPGDARNLAVRAAQALLGPDPVPGVAIAIEKRIPIGAGLGGGSSDAAATLRALDGWRGLRTPPDRLAGLAASLGSDVPYLLQGGGAICTGRGEHVTPAPCPEDLPLLVAWPRVPLATAAVFARCRPPLTPIRDRASVLFARLGSGPGWAGIGPLLWNRLEEPARALCPQVGILLEAMKTLDTQGVVMTGSGSAVVALFDSTAAAARGEASLQGRLPCWTAVATTVRD